MQSLPPVNWELARRMARPFSGELPSATRAGAHAMTASLRLAAKRAGELVVDAGGLPGAPATRVVVCDRTTWARGAQTMVADVLDALPAHTFRPRPARSLTAAGYGTLAGIILGRMGQHVLGQYDPAASRLYLVAPNIWHMQEARGFVPDDFQLWVAAHEQTHALQFTAAPWLLDHLTSRLATIAGDEVGGLEVARNLVGGHGFAAAMASPDARRAMDEVTAVMTLLEGHADYISDTVGATHIPSVKRLRSAFARTHRPSALARLLPALDKNAQYRDGLAFCRTVTRRRGAAALRPAFDSPQGLPNMDEISNPLTWLRRVRGTA